MRCAALYLALIISVGSAHAQSPVIPAPGSTAFCLYELPSEEAGKRRWINLGIVQYVESSRNDVSIYYGGGRFGAGHVARIPINGPADVPLILDRIRQAAASCR